MNNSRLESERNGARQWATAVNLYIALYSRTLAVFGWDFFTVENTKAKKLPRLSLRVHFKFVRALCARLAHFPAARNFQKRIPRDLPPFLYKLVYLHFSARIISRFILTPRRVPSCLLLASEDLSQGRTEYIMLFGVGCTIVVEMRLLCRVLKLRWLDSFVNGQSFLAHDHIIFSLFFCT